MSTLISPDDTWTLWAIVIGITALSFYIEQKYKIGAKISSVLLALIGSLILVNLRIMPTTSPVFTAIGDYILPLALSLIHI